MSYPLLLRAPQLIFWDLGPELCTCGGRQIGGKCLIAFWPKLGLAFLRKQGNTFMSKILKNVKFLFPSPFDTFCEFPAVFGNSQDESKFVIPEWRRNILVASEGPLLQTLKRQICKEEEEEEEEEYNMVGWKWGADEFWIKTYPSRSNASAKLLFRRHISIL